MDSYLLASYLVDLVWLNRAFIPNFSFLGSLDVAKIYFPRGWLGVITRIKANLSSTELCLTSQLQLSFAKHKVPRTQAKNGPSLKNMLFLK